MDAFGKHFNYKGSKFSFHKNLARGIKRWICTKDNCSAYVKTNDPENYVIFENWTHTHVVNNDDDDHHKSAGITDITRDNEVDLHSIPAELRINSEKRQEPRMQLIKQKKNLPINEVHLSNQECEKKSDFKRHGDLLPQHVRLICVGPSNCGKTTALLSLIYI